MQTILFVIMISDSFSSYRSDNQRIPYLKSVEIKVHNQIGNHAHLRPRDSKLANKCVYPLIFLFLSKLLYQIGNTPTQQLEIPRYQAELEKTSLPSSPREYLDQIGNEGSHLTYFFIHKPTPQQWQKIKGCKRHKRNTHSRQIRVLKQNTTTTLQKPSQFWYPFSAKNKGWNTCFGLNLIYKI